MIKILPHLFLALIFLERIKSTFSNRKHYAKFKTGKENFLCCLMVILYIFVLLLAFSSIYSKHYQFNSIIVLTGLLVWTIGIIYRRNSIRSLGKFWSIYRVPCRLRHIITLGAFTYSRHPYYSASILELIGYSLIFQSLPAFFVAVFIYLPLVYLRAKQEERFLIQLFPDQYTEYQRETPIVFDLKKYLSDSRFLNNLKQLLRVGRRYGIQQIFKIIQMNKAVMRYFRNYVISQNLAALDKIGFIDALLEEQEIDISTYAKERNINFRILRFLCDYLYVVRLFEKKALRYSLTRYGHELLSHSRGVFDFIYAYAPIFENLDGLLKNEKQYGRDIQRRGEFVGRASAELAELFPFIVARFMLSKHHLKQILDLGSGSGDFLIGFCKRNGLRGCGIDLSPSAVAYATRKAAENNINDRVKFMIGNILQLSDFENSCGGTDVITCMFVLHEFLSVSEQLVLDVFASIRRAFPGKYILITELTRCSLDHLHHSPTGITEHHLFHYLSNQGLATSDEWRKIFKKANLTVIEEERLDLAEQSIFLLK